MEALETALRMIAAGISGALAELPDNKNFYTYVIRGSDDSPYITRTLLPRLLGYRVMIHRIHRADEDEHPHNHPWHMSRFMIISGAYLEHRYDDYIGPNRFKINTYGIGDINTLDAKAFHRIDSVMPNTWTVGLVGRKVQDWGFLTGRNHVVPHKQYFQMRKEQS